MPAAFPNMSPYGAAQPQYSTASSYQDLLGGLLPGALSAYGTSSAAGAQTHADSSAINNQTATMGDINKLYSGQEAIGNQSFSALGSALGLNGHAPDPSTFYNMPGYQFAVNQGTQAINRQAAAQGSLNTPNTLASVGQYVTGTASQDYNTYIQQLMGTAGFGATANQNVTGAYEDTSGNIAQLLQNRGNAAAGGIAGTTGVGSTLLNQAGPLLSLLGKGYNALTGANSSGVSGGGGGGGGGGDFSSPQYDSSGNYVGTGSLDYQSPDAGSPDSSGYNGAGSTDYLSGSGNDPYGGFNF